MAAICAFLPFIGTNLNGSNGSNPASPFAGKSGYQASDSKPVAPGLGARSRETQADLRFERALEGTLTCRQDGGGALVGRLEKKGPQAPRNQEPALRAARVALLKNGAPQPPSSSRSRRSATSRRACLSEGAAASFAGTTRHFLAFPDNRRHRSGFRKERHAVERGKQCWVRRTFVEAERFRRCAQDGLKEIFSGIPIVTV